MRRDSVEYNLWSDVLEDLRDLTTLGDVDGVIACGSVLVAFNVQVYNNNIRVSSHLFGDFVDDVVSQKPAPSDDKDWSGNYFCIHAAGKEENGESGFMSKKNLEKMQEGICM
jgi:hypothetical protein